jgi:hypothetical protein
MFKKVIGRAIEMNRQLEHELLDSTYAQYLGV